MAWPRLSRRITSRLAPLGCIALPGVIAWLLYASGKASSHELLAMLIGGLVGLVELLGRYRHAPIRAVLTWAGLSYVMVNVGAAWFAFQGLDAFDVLTTTAHAKELTQALAAGFGSLVVMRSSVFKVRVGEADVGIGPAAILDTLLLVADRGVDRREAVARAQDVTGLIAHVSDPRVVAKMLTTYSLALMQNVDDKTSTDLVAAVAKIMGDPEVPDAIKMDIVALRLGVIVGPEVLEAAADAIGARLQMPPGPATSDPTAPGAPSLAHSPIDGASTAVSNPSSAQLKAEIDAEP